MRFLLINASMVFYIAYAAAKVALTCELSAGNLGVALTLAVMGWSLAYGLRKFSKAMKLTKDEGRYQRRLVRNVRLTGLLYALK